MKKINIFMDRHFAGCTILAGFVYFINPYNLVPGVGQWMVLCFHNQSVPFYSGRVLSGYMFDIPCIYHSVLVLEQIGSTYFIGTIHLLLRREHHADVLISSSHPSTEAL